MTDQPDLPNLIADVSWLPHRYDSAGSRIQFVRMEATKRGALTFLADYQPAEGDSCWFAAEQVLTTPIAPQPWNFIFHAAFARSTLLVKAFELPRLSVGLSEPAILNDLAAGLGSPLARALLLPIVDLLARPHGSGVQVVIKPSNAANVIIGTLLSARPQSRAVLLSVGLKGFLGSVAKKGLMGRRWARRLHLHVSKYAPLDLGLTPAEAHELTDLQIAGLAWLLHQRHFAALLEQFPARQLATLTSESIGAEPAAAIHAVARHFGIAFDLKQAEAVASGPLFDRHAKLGTDYRSTVAREDAAALSPVIMDEIEKTSTWIEHIAAHARLNLPVSRPLQE